MGDETRLEEEMRGERGNSERNSTTILSLIHSCMRAPREDLSMLASHAAPRAIAGLNKMVSVG